MKSVALGVLGHVDVGKTAIVRRLALLHSTAALDKHPQSRERGITIDLGFSAMIFDDVELRVTLVDCPGHLSLLRTIIAGAHIIDMVLLVVDVVHGIQQQTLDCLVIGEIVPATNKDTIIVLNKVDLIPEHKRIGRIKKISKSIREQVRGTVFEHCDIIPVAATNSTWAGSGEKDGIPQLSNCIKNVALSCQQVRDTHGPFHMSADHCFGIPGHGTVLTGTVMRGEVSVGGRIEIPSLGLTRTVKSIQAFRVPQTRAKAGDRVGLCVSGLNPKAVERCIVTFPGSVSPIKSVIAVVRGTRFYKDRCVSGELFHIQIGHVNVPARVEFFGARELQTTTLTLLQNQEHGDDSNALKCDILLPLLKMDWDVNFAAQDGLVEINSGCDVLPYGGEEENQDQSPSLRTLQLAVVNFEEPTFIPFPSIGIAISPKYAKGKGSGGCHTAFYLRLLETCSDSRKPKIYTSRERQGVIIRPAGVKIDLGGGKQGWTEAVCGGMFKKETNLTPFVNMIAETETGDLGRITGVFGKSGKFRVNFPLGAEVSEGKSIKLCFRRHKYDDSMSMNQDVYCEAINRAESQNARFLLRKQQQQQSQDDEEEIRQPLQGGQEYRNGLVVSIQEGNHGGIVGDEEKYTVCIIDGFFKPEENVKLFKGKTVELENGMKGHLLGPFGKAGKCKVEFKTEISHEVMDPTAAKVLNSKAYVLI